MEKTIKVEGMHCKSCEMLLSDSIGEIEGIQKVSADSKKGIVNIEYTQEKAVEETKKAITKEGYRVIE